RMELDQRREHSLLAPGGTRVPGSAVSPQARGDEPPGVRRVVEAAGGCAGGGPGGAPSSDVVRRTSRRAHDLRGLLRGSRPDQDRGRCSAQCLGAEERSVPYVYGRRGVAFADQVEADRWWGRTL